MKTTTKTTKTTKDKKYRNRLRSALREILYEINTRSLGDIDGCLEVIDSVMAIAAIALTEEEEETR